MRTLLVVLMLAGFPLTVSGQEPEEGSAVWKVEFDAPAGWHVNHSSPGGIFLSTSENKNWVPFVPPQPHAWFILMRLKGRCEKDEPMAKFGRDALGRPLRSALGCKLGLTVIGGYWDDDEEQNKRSLQMREMYASLRLRQ